MKQIDKLLSFRESIKVVDATLRDGGLVNDFYFSDEFVKNLYKANIDAYMSAARKCAKYPVQPSNWE